MTLGGLALAQGGLQALAGPAQAWKTPPGYGPLSPVLSLPGNTPGGWAI